MGASVFTVQHPCLSCTPSLLEEILADTGIRDMTGPSLVSCANEGAYLTLPDSSSLQDELLAATVIPDTQAPSPGSSTVIVGDHPALPWTPSLLEEILAARAIQDTPSSSLEAAAEEEGVEEILEAPLSEDDYQALLAMLPVSPGLQYRWRRRKGHLLPEPL